MKGLERAFYFGDCFAGQEFEKSSAGQFLTWSFLCGYTQVLHASAAI